jgi:hypothetical protein
LCRYYSCPPPISNPVIPSLHSAFTKRGRLSLPSHTNCSHSACTASQSQFGRVSSAPSFRRPWAHSSMACSPTRCPPVQFGWVRIPIRVRIERSHLLSSSSLRDTLGIVISSLDVIGKAESAVCSCTKRSLTTFPRIRRHCMAVIRSIGASDTACPHGNSTLLTEPVGVDHLQSPRESKS